MQMLLVHLNRFSDDGTRTLGVLTFPDGTTLFTLEEPWNNNKIGASCIPKGTYTVSPHGWEPGTKLKQKNAYRLEGTAPRTAILIHSGNTVDDIEGCILPGKTRGRLKGKDAVLSSKVAMEELRSKIGNNQFKLVIS